MPNILLQYSTETLAVEVLYNPLVSTTKQCLNNLLTAFTKHKHLIHAGYSFAGTGSWVLQNGVFTFEDFVEAFQETEVQRVLRNYSSINIHVHCPSEGSWTLENLRKQSPQFSRVYLNPTDCCDSVPGSQALLQFLDRTMISMDVKEALQASTIVGNIKFNRPTLYIFPGGQGDCALFGINGFNMLIDGGFSKKPCFWDFIRHLDRLDAVMLTRLSETNCSGITTMMKRKVANHIYPHLGYIFCNLGESKSCLPEGTTKDSEDLLVGVMAEGHKLAECLKLMNLPPHPCYRESVIEPFVLYQKVGHGTLDMYILNPPKDSKEIKEFFQQWNSNRNDFGNVKCGMKMNDQELSVPLSHFLSISALLVWRPVKPTDPITRILFTGSTPQNKLFEAFEKLKFMEVLKHQTCTQSKLQPKPAEKPKAKTEKFVPKTLLNRQSTHSPSSPSPKSTGTSTPKKETPPKPVATKASVEIAKAASKKLSQVSQAKKTEEKRTPLSAIKREVKETKPVIIPKEKTDAKKNAAENRTSASKTSRTSTIAAAKKSPENKESPASTPKEETAKSKLSATTIAKNKINKTKSATAPPSKPAPKPPAKAAESKSKPSEAVKKVPSKGTKKPDSSANDTAKAVSKPTTNGTIEEPKKMNGHVEEPINQQAEKKEEKVIEDVKPIAKEEDVKKEVEEVPVKETPAVSKDIKIDRSAIESIARNLTSLNEQQKPEDKEDDILPQPPQQDIEVAKKDTDEIASEVETKTVEEEVHKEEEPVSETIPEPIEEKIVEAIKKIEEVKSEPIEEIHAEAQESSEMLKEPLVEHAPEEISKEEILETETKPVLEDVKTDIEEDISKPSEEAKSDQHEDIDMLKDKLPEETFEISEVTDVNYPKEVEDSTKPIIDYPSTQSPAEQAKEPDATYSIAEDTGKTVDASSYDITEVEESSLQEEEEEGSSQDPVVSFSQAPSESSEAKPAPEEETEEVKQEHHLEEHVEAPEIHTARLSPSPKDSYLDNFKETEEMGEKLIEKDILQCTSPIPVETYPEEDTKDKSQAGIYFEETKEKKYYSDEKDEDTREDLEKPFDEEYETMQYEDQQAQRESASPIQDDSEREIFNVSPPRGHLDSNMMGVFKDFPDDDPPKDAYEKHDTYRKEEYSDEESSRRSDDDDEDSNLRLEKEVFGSLVDSNVTAEAASSGDDGIDMTVESPKGEDFYIPENKHDEEEKHAEHPMKSDAAPSGAQAGDEYSDDKSSKDDISKDEISKDFSTEDLSKEVDELFGNASEFLPNIRDNNIRAEEHAAHQVSYHLSDGSFENASGMDPMMASFIKEDAVGTEKEVDECKDKMDRMKEVEEFDDMHPDEYDSNILRDDITKLDDEGIDRNDDGIDDEYSLSCQDDISMYQVADRTTEALSSKEFESCNNLEKELDNFETKEKLDGPSEELKPYSDSPRLSISSKEDLQEKDLVKDLEAKKNHDDGMSTDQDKKYEDDDDYSDDGEIVRHATPPGEQNFYQNIGPVGSGPLNELQGPLMEQYLAGGLAGSSRPMIDVTEQPLYEVDSEDEGKSPIVEQPVYANTQVADFPEFVTLSGGTTPSEPMSPRSPLDARNRLGQDDQMRKDGFHINEPATLLPPVSEDVSDSASSSPVHQTRYGAPIKGEDSYHIIYNKAFEPQAFPKEEEEEDDLALKPDEELFAESKTVFESLSKSGHSTLSVSPLKLSKIEMKPDEELLAEPKKDFEILSRSGHSSPSDLEPAEELLAEPKEVLESVRISGHSSPSDLAPKLSKIEMMPAEENLTEPEKVLESLRRSGHSSPSDLDLKLSKIEMVPAEELLDEPIEVLESLHKSGHSSPSDLALKLSKIEMVPAEELLAEPKEVIESVCKSGHSSPSMELTDPKDVILEEGPIDVLHPVQEDKLLEKLKDEEEIAPGSKADLDLELKPSQPDRYSYSYDYEAQPDSALDYHREDENIESPDEKIRQPSDGWKFDGKQEHRRTGSIAKCENGNKSYNDVNTPSEITPESPEDMPNPAMTASFYEVDTRCRGYESADISDEIGQSMGSGLMSDLGREACRSPYEDVLERNRKLRLSGMKKDGSSVESPEEAYPKSQSESSIEPSSEDDSPRRRRPSPQSYTNKGYVRDDSEDNPIDDYPMQDQMSSSIKWSPDFHLPPQEFQSEDANKGETSHRDFNLGDWDKPMGLPTPPHTPVNGSTPCSPAKRMRPGARGVAKPKINPVYVDLAYVPHHGDPNYSNIEFFDHIRARYYVLSGTNPSKEVLNALLEAKKGWKEEAEVTIIPTYETDTLGYWMALNQETLTALNIDVAPSASRCTVNLQDHETSCAAYRLEF